MYSLIVFYRMEELVHREIKLIRYLKQTLKNVQPNVYLLF